MSDRTGSSAVALPISVVVPAYNAAQTLDTALASVAGQTARPEAVVVVDDGSTDGTGDVAASWSAHLPLTIIRLTENRGLATARSRAIDANDLPLIALLDADDVWLPDHLAVMHAAYSRWGGLITADAYRWLPGVGVERRSYRRLRPIPPAARQRLALLDHDFVFIGTLFHRAEYSRAGGFRSGIRAVEDWDLWIRMSRVGVVVTGTPHPTVLYRLRAGGISLSESMRAAEIRTLQNAAQEAPSESERRAALRTVRRLQAAEHLLEAYEAAEQGRHSAARLEAWRALVAQPRAAAKALAMMAAPRSFLRLRARAAGPVDRWIHQHAQAPSGYVSSATRE